MVAQRSTKRLTRRPADQYQLALPLAWLSEAEFIEALHQRGVPGIRRVRFRPNRSRLISLSTDHTTLNLHECFRGAAERVIDAIAVFVRKSSGTAETREAVRVMRVWSDGQVASEADPVARRGGAHAAGTPEQRAFVAAAYKHLNRELFGGGLPDAVPIRLSNRMIRRFGHVEYRRARGERAIVEIALNMQLLLEHNERHLLDTLVHEMAHVEAWVVHGHRGHDEPWQRIARRVGCEVQASSRVRMRRTRPGVANERVPDLDELLETARSRRLTPGPILRHCV